VLPCTTELRKISGAPGIVELLVKGDREFQAAALELAAARLNERRAKYNRNKSEDEEGTWIHLRVGHLLHDGGQQLLPHLLGRERREGRCV
jgi:hypothetical protein